MNVIDQFYRRHYSQWGQLERVLDLVFHEPGYYIEIGAWDGKNMSQTLYLEEKGWKGVCVDPLPHGFENRTCMLCNKAISADGLPRKFIWVTVDRNDGGDVSYLSGFVDSVRVHLEFIQKNCIYDYTEVDTITIGQLYEQYHLPDHVNFLSIDTEGAEVEILQSIDWNRYSYDMITFEHNKDHNMRRWAWELLERNNYVPLGNVLEYDDIFVSRRISEEADFE